MAAISTFLYFFRLDPVEKYITFDWIFIYLFIFVFINSALTFLNIHLSDHHDAAVKVVSTVTGK